MGSTLVQANQEKFTKAESELTNITDILGKLTSSQVRSAGPNP